MQLFVTLSGRTRIALTVVIGLVTASALLGHVVREAPWHPVSSAYLRSLFYLNLRPIPWNLVEDEYRSPLVDPAYEGLTVLDLLRPADALGSEAVSQAITDRSPTALYRSSTTMVASLVRHYLGGASEALDDPGLARRELQRAESIHRALSEGGIEVGDAESFDRLGQAWLALSSSIGTKGVLGVAARPANRETFESARREIETYLLENFPAGSTVEPAGTIAPIPAHAPHAEAVVQHFAKRLPPGSRLNDQSPLPKLRLNFESRGIDEADLFLVAYGDMLFDSAAIFGEPARTLGIACSTCHNRSDINRDLFIPGMSHQPGAVDVDGHLFNQRFNDRRADPLDIPSLRGLRFTAPYGRDGRFASLRDFTRNVIVNEFGGPEPTAMMLDALVAYMFEFDWLPSPLLRPDGRLVAEAPAAARRGEAIFHRPFAGMGNRSCATCHVPSSNFIDRKSHDIGTGDPSAPGARDAFFDTPTLLNAVHTAPYFHNGSQPTLRSVVEWFDERHDLELAPTEAADLTAYLEAIGDAEDPYEEFDDEHTPFALAWDELSTFLTTLDTLLPSRDRHHALILLDTVAPDLRADVVGAWEPTAVAGRAYEIADVLDDIRAAINADDWPAAEELYRQYQELADAHGPFLR